LNISKEEEKIFYTECIEIFYDREKDIILTHFTGKLDQNSLSEYARQIAFRSNKYKCRKVLFDLRDVENEFNEMDTYCIFKILREAGIDNTWSRALICEEYPKVLFLHQQVANIHGAQVRVFTKINEAEEWLRKTEVTVKK